MSRRFGEDERGFTLIEVMIAALILIIALAGLFTVFVGGEGSASAATRQAQLINVADQQIEQVRAEVSSTGFNSLALAADPAVATTYAAPGAALSTYADPNALALTNSTCGTGSPSEEYAIENNYDSLSTPLPSSNAGSVLAGSAATSLDSPPSGFANWAACDAGTEPLEVISGDTFIKTGTASTPCSSSQIYQECSESVGSATVTVNIYVTDTYVGCGATSTTQCPIFCTSAYSASTGCPTAATTICASTPASCAVYGCTGGSSSTSFPTSTGASTACADARRLIVAVTPPTTGTTSSDLGRLTPIYVSSIFTNPTPTTSGAGGIGLQLGAGL